MSISDMYNVSTSPDNKSLSRENKESKQLNLKGRGTNNIVLEFGNEQLDVATSEYIKTLEKDLKKANAKIKNLESGLSRVSYEMNKLKTELAAIKQILNR